MKERVAVALSGGVDSSVAAALLLKQGYEVIGKTMRYCLPGPAGTQAKGRPFQGIEDARRVARILGIRHYVVNFSRQLQEKVIEDFCQEYVRGRTPNPCVRCNKYIKFDALLKKAVSLKARYLATGHYARVVHSPKSVVDSQTYLLKKGKDPKKDQSYFLYSLSQRQLARVLFPLGEYTKEQVRQLAREFSLPVADKPGSQEICFLPDNDYRGFLLRRLTQMKKKGMNADLKAGPVVDTKGTVVGQHKGIAFYTIGQREGLGIALGYPAHITTIDAAHNTIVVGTYQDACSKECIVKEPHFIITPRKKKIASTVKIRYNHKAMAAQVTLLNRAARVRFRNTQFAITPGQSAVFYDKDVVLGGGIIDKVKR